MAYIDVDNFAKAIYDFPAIDEDTANALIFLLRTFPTEDVQEVKHGYWLDNIQKFTSPAGVTKDYLVSYKCSVCGRTENRKEPYCNCGAKMDGGKYELLDAVGNYCKNFKNKADFVEVVRCEDCNYADKHYSGNKLLYITCKNSDREALKEDDFCSYGERSNKC